jgi:hypothetical protein
MFYLIPGEQPLLTSLNVTFVMPPVPSGDNYAIYRTLIRRFSSSDADRDFDP